MSIKTTLNPMGTIGNVILLNEYLNADITGQSVNIPTSLTLADSLGFDLTTECIYHGDINNWYNIMYLGGRAAQGWFGLQHNGAIPDSDYFIWSNNGTTNWRDSKIPRNTPLVIKLDRNGLTVNGTLSQWAATEAYNKTQVVTGNWHKNISVKSWVLKSNGEKIIDVHAAMIHGRKYLYDFVSKTAIKSVVR